MKILVVDVGGTNVKMMCTGHGDVRRFPSGPELTADAMIAGVLATTADWHFDVVSIGLPTPIIAGKPLREPHNLSTGWVDCDYGGKFAKPTRLINDASLQALGSYEGGRMLFLGLGTGMGSALIIDGVIAPLELAHLPYRKKKTFEDYVGQRGLDSLGKKEWTKAVFDVVARLKAATVADYVVIGGGSAKKLDEMPPGCRRGDNRNVFLGGCRLWDDEFARKMAASGPPSDLETETNPPAALTPTHVDRTKTARKPAAKPEDRSKKQKKTSR
jgi:polyphosphate glucokinase